MNNQFMFTPQLNPYADNARYLKKAFSPRALFLQLIGIALILVTMIYGAACIFSYRNYQTFIQSEEDKILNMMYSSAEGLYQIIYCIFAFLAMLAFVILVVTVKADNENTPAITNSPFVLFRIFFVFTAVTSVNTIFRSGITPLLIAALTDKENIDRYLYEYLLLDCIPAIVCAVWALMGFLFTLSISRTVKCKGLYAKFGKAYIVIARIYALINIALPITYFINGFKGGVFNNINSDRSIKSDIISSMPSASVILAVFYVLFALVLFFSTLSAKQYITAVNNARRSFNTSGNNLYMNEDSVYASYYGQTYTSAQFNNPPPVPAPPVQQPVSPFYHISADKLNIPPHQIPKNDVPPRPPVGNSNDNNDEKIHL